MTGLQNSLDTHVEGQDEIRRVRTSQDIGHSRGGGNPERRGTAETPPIRPPDLPYAPKRKKPLSLRNPLDYLQLLYWVFYFPQAIRWYVETFGNLPWVTNGRDAFRQDPLQRRLAMQGVILALSTPFLVASLLRWCGIP